jgi:hypothetical protein
MAMPDDVCLPSPGPSCPSRCGPEEHLICKSCLTSSSASARVLEEVNDRIDYAITRVNSECIAS